MTRTPIPPPSMGATPAPFAFPGEPIPSRQTAPIARLERNSMPDCSFPAAAILQQMRQIAREADSLMPVHPEAALTRLRAWAELESLRVEHETRTGCPCWQEAIEAAGPAFVQGPGSRPGFDAMQPVAGEVRA